MLSKTALAPSMLHVVELMLRPTKSWRMMPGGGGSIKPGLRSLRRMKMLTIQSTTSQAALQDLLDPIVTKQLRITT
jgi:hypothetical protein